MDDEVYKKFDGMIKYLVLHYLKYNKQIDKKGAIPLFSKEISKLSSSIKKLYENKELFQYILEKYYTEAFNPFTTAYYTFMNLHNEGTDVDELFDTIAHGILQRLIKEKKENNIYAIFCK